MKNLFLTKLRVKRIFAFFIVVCFLTTTSLPAFAAGNEISRSEEAKLANLLSGDDAAKYPHGKFEFLATKMTTSEDLKSVDVAIVRKGGTEGEATVTFKAIDITAKYGNDYKIKVDNFPFEKELEPNPEAVPLMETLASSSGQLDETADNLDKKEDVSEIEEQPADNKNDVETIEEQPVDNKNDVATVEESTGDVKKGIKGAKKSFTGVESDQKTWREADGEIKAKALDEYSEFYKEMPGVKYTVKFEDGENIKKLKFETIDDTISESDEQVLFAILDPTGGVTGDSVNAYMNITDNDKNETAKFEMAQSEMSVERTAETADIIIKRVAGLHKYAKIVVSTAAITANPGSDYQPVSTEVAFVPGMKEQTIKIPILKKSSMEDKLQFAVVLDRESPNVSKENNTTNVTLLNPVTYQMEAADGESNLQSADENSEQLMSWVEDSNGQKVRGLDARDVTSGNWDRSANYITTFINAYNSNRNATISNLDLNLVEKITVKWENPCGGTYYENKNSCGKVTSKGYYTNFKSGFKIGNNEKKTIDGKFGWTTDTINLDDNDRKQNSLTVYSQTWGGNCYSRMKIESIKLYYKGYDVIINYSASDPDAKIIPKKWINANETENLPEQNIGSMAMTVGGVSKTLYDGDTVTFRPDYFTGVDTSKVYLWGYKMERIGGKYDRFIKSNTLTLNSTFCNQNKDYLLSNGSKPVFQVRPVFRAKNAFVKINYDTEKTFLNGFVNGQILKVGMLDKISYIASGKKGYFASGYSGMKLQEKNVAVTDDAIERDIDGATVEGKSSVFTSKSKDFKALDVIVNPVTPGNLEFTPTNTYTTLTITNSIPVLTAKVDPESGEKDKGAIQYWNPGGNGSITGDKDKPLTISPLEKGEIYSLNGITQDGYQVKWKDFTGDVNGDGRISKEEADYLKGYEVQRDTITGEFYHYIANFDKPLIYYSFVPKPKGGREAKMSGQILRSGGDILQNTKNTGTTGLEVPVEGATVTVGNHVLITDEFGEFSIKDSDFLTGEKHAISIRYNGYNYIGYINSNVYGQYIIKEYDDFVPYNFKIFSGNSEVSPDIVTNRDSTLKFSFDVTPKKVGIEPVKAIIRVYSKDNQKRKEYQVNSTNRHFELQKNPASEGIAPGDYMTIQIYDQNDKVYIEHNVGFMFKRDINTFSLLSSFDTPLKPAVDFIGKVDTAMDLGLAGKTDDYFTKNKDAWTINFGFSKEFSSDGGSGDDDEKSSKEKLKEAAASDSNNKTSETANGAVDKDKAKKNQSKLTSQFQLGISVAFSLVMNADPDKPGEFYFKEMILTAKVSGGVNISYEVMTPIGIPVFMKLSLSGDITAMLVIEQYDDKKFYFDGNGEINFLNAGVSDINRDFTIYGKFIIRPTISLTVGVGFSFLNISITGTAAFDLNFTTLNQGSGKVTLTAELTLKILIFSKSWSVANKTYDLFSYGGLSSFNADKMFDGIDYLYEKANFEDMPRDYLKKRGTKWNPNERALLGTGTTENELQSGVYPYPDSKMAKISDDQYLLVFVDDDSQRDSKNRTLVKYSIFDGTSWQEPVVIDDDGTLDDSPCVFDIGDQILIAWSSAYKPVADDDGPIEALNLRNIKSVFFDKNSKTIGDVQNVTKNTEADYCADTQPSIAYYDDGSNKNLIIYYTKTEYEATGSSDEETNEQTEAVVGDVLNGYSVIAYMFYDFNQNKWRNTYSDTEKQEIINNGAYLNNGEEVSESNFATYEAEWYGQGFLDLSPKAIIDESEVLIQDDPEVEGDELWSGYWSDLPELTENDDNIDPKIEESTSISYNGLALYTYILDMDQNPQTTFDRELYLQIYNFDEKQFSHPIMLTSDSKKDSNPMFIRNNNETYLYYLSDGNIMNINISDLVKNGLHKTTVGDKEIYIVDKRINTYKVPETALKHKDDKPISEFSVNTDGNNNIYLMWVEDISKLKEGITENTPESALPENQVKERPLFAARKSFGDYTESKMYDENGDIMTYPETYTDGDGNIKTIDYTQVEDINGEIGVVNVGDEVIKKVKESNWSEAVRLTDENGANYNELSFVVLPDGTLRTVFVKSYSDLVDIEGKTMLAENVDERTLMNCDFVPESKIEVSIDKLSNVIQNSVVQIKTNIENKGLLNQKNLKVEYYLKTNSEEEKITESTIDELKGGSTAQSGISWDVPELIENASIIVKVLNSQGEVLSQGTQTIKCESILDVSDVQVDFESRENITITATVTNNGNKESTERKVSARAAGKVIGETTVKVLGIGESKEITIDAAITHDMFVKQIKNDSSVEEYLELEVFAGGQAGAYTVNRSASAEIAAQMEKVESILLSVPDEINIYRDSTQKIETKVKTTDEECPATGYLPEEEGMNVVYTSSNSNIIEFDNYQKLLTAESPGTAYLNVNIVPKNYTYNLATDSTRELDNFPLWPESVIKTKTIKVNVRSASTSTSTNYIPPVTSNNTTTETPTATQQPTKTPIVKITEEINVKAETDANGNYKANVSVEEINNAIERSLENAKLDEGNAIPVVKILVESDLAGKSVDVAIPKDAFSNITEKGIGEILLDSKLGKIMLDRNTLEKIYESLTDKDESTTISMNISKIDSDDIINEYNELAKNEMTKKLGDRPIYEFSIKAGETEVSDFNDGTVTVNVPYELKTNEDNDSLVIYYIEQDGNLKVVPNSRYDVDNKTIVFEVNHFSKYAIGYNKISFNDVAEDAWYNNAVSFLAARDIVNGVGNGLFGSDKVIKRGDLLKMVMDAYNIKVEGNLNDNFTDAGNTYYTTYLATAKHMGFVTGTGNNCYEPEKEISRQDMFVIIYRILKKLDKLPAESSDKTIADFTDSSDVHTYASEAMEAFIRSSVVSGDGKYLTPDKSSKRVEIAQVLYNLLSK